MRKSHKVVIATRGSKLALWQAERVKVELEKIHPDIKIELKKVKTTGDKILDAPLAKIGGKGLFVKEIEEALLRKEADLAVHSMKDVPTDLPKGLHIPAICKRENQRDALITQISNLKSQISKFKDLPYGARVGTSSLRRACQLLNIRPDLKIIQLRGNLDTRIRKLDEGQFDGIIVAVAGVKRLGMSYRITEILEPDISLPAIGQGAIGIECRTDDRFINKLVAPLNHEKTTICVRAERAFLKRLGGGCQVPIAAYARIISQESGVRSQELESNSELKTQNSKLNSSLITVRLSSSTLSSLPKGSPKSRHSLLSIDGLVGSVSGDRLIRGCIEGSPEEAESLGIKLAEDLLSKGGGEILAKVYSKR